MSPHSRRQRLLNSLLIPLYTRSFLPLFPSSLLLRFHPLSLLPHPHLKHPTLLLPCSSRRRRRSGRIGGRSSSSIGSWSGLLILLLARIICNLVSVLLDRVTVLDAVAALSRSAFAWSGVEVYGMRDAAGGSGHFEIRAASSCEYIWVEAAVVERERMRGEWKTLPVPPFAFSWGGDVEEVMGENAEAVG